jgi:hypothetical protein
MNFFINLRRGFYIIMSEQGKTRKDLYILILILDDALIDKTTRPFRPGLLRQLMTNSLELFPQNSIFLSLYTWNESRLRIYDRVRTVLRDIVLTPANDNIISRLFAIRYELRCGTIHSAYSAFENALASPACCANAGLWRLYIRFCLQTKEYRRKTRDTFYRAINACPWAKPLHMMAFLDLGGIMSFRALESAHEFLVRQGFRIHIDLEAILEELGSSNSRG